MRNPTTLAAGWEEFSQAVMPEKAAPFQRQEMRRAFYAGAHWMLSSTTGASHQMPEDQACTYLNGLSSEVAQFIKDMEEGRA